MSELPLQSTPIQEAAGRAATDGVIQGRYALAVGNPKTAARKGWEWKKLASIAQLETGHTPSRRHPEYWNGDVPWIGIRDAGAHHGGWIDDTEQHVTQAGIDNSSTRLLPAKTVCLSRTASIGYVVVIRRPMCTSQDFVNWVCGPELDYRFLMYALLAEQDAILQFAHGTTHQTIYFPEVKALHICAPEIGEQRNICDVLQALDDKIEHNRKTSRALERLARAMFKAWFVDFEPVKAKAMGATPFPGMPPAAFAALPTRFVDSELGPVPEGWKVRSLADTTNVTMGQSPKSEFYNESGRGLPFHQGVTDYGFRFPTHRVYCTVEARLAEPGDVLVSVRAPVGRINVADQRLILGRGLAGLRHRAGRQSYLLYHMQSVFAVEDAVGDGTIYKAVNRDFFSNLPVVAPSDAVADAFERIAAPMDALLASLEQESRKLAELRDYLLPKLLSGEVRVGGGSRNGATDEQTLKNPSTRPSDGR